MRAVVSIFAALLPGAMAATLAATLAATPALAQEAPPPPQHDWSWQGPFGTYNLADAQRGFQVYKEVCSNCHSMNDLHYRDLAGIGLSDGQIKAIAASVQVPDGRGFDQGSPKDGPGTPASSSARPSPMRKRQRRR